LAFGCDRVHSQTLIFTVGDHSCSCSHHSVRLIGVSLWQPWRPNAAHQPRRFLASAGWACYD
jgi:hypothetical protein